MNSRRRVNQYGPERGLILDLRLRYKMRGNPNAEFATPAFEIQGLPHPRPEVSKELEFSKSRTPSASFIQAQNLSHSPSKNLWLRG